MSSSTSEEEMLMYPPYDTWKASSESIVTQKITKISKSESGLKFQQYNPNLTFSQLELRELRLKNFKESQERAQKWELLQRKSRFPRMFPTRSLLRDELEMLKINMSLHERAMESEMLEERRKREGIRRAGRKLVKYMSEAPILQKFSSPKVRDLLSEIDDSELAKTDKVSWKFLKRGPSVRKEAINAKKFVLHVQTMYLPVLDLLSDPSFVDVQPLKMTCPNCRFFVTTTVKKISTIRTKLTSILLGLLRLCLAPNSFHTFSHSVHLCPLCKIYLGFCPAFNIRMKKRKYQKIVRLNV